MQIIYQRQIRNSKMKLNLSTLNRQYLQSLSLKKGGSYVQCALIKMELNKVRPESKTRVYVHRSVFFLLCDVSHCMCKRQLCITAVFGHGRMLRYTAVELNKRK